MRQLPGRIPFRQLAQGGNVLGRGAAAAAHDGHQTLFEVVLHHIGKLAGRLVVAAEGVGQAGVGVGRNMHVGQAGQVLHVGFELVGAEGAVEAHAQQRQVADGVPEGLHRLARERAARGVGDGARNHKRHLPAAFIKELLHGVQGGFGVERVEDGFNQQRIHAPIHEAAHLLVVSGGQLIKRYGPEAGAVDVGRKGGRAVGGADGPGHETGLVGRAGRILVGGRPGQPRRLVVQLVHHVLQPIVGLGDSGAGEGVGFHHVGPGGEVFGVDAADKIGAGEAEQVVVAAQGLGVLGEAGPTEVLLGERVALNHGAHGAVEHEHALAQDGV